MLFVVVERDRALQYDVLRSVLLGPHGRWARDDVSLVHVQQSEGGPFNRGLLFNVGFLVGANRTGASAHVVFHDVDMLPESTMDYGRARAPVVQYATRASQFGYRMPYPRYLGGVVGFDAAAYRHVNGFSNRFWGWGGEDDDLYRRVRSAFPVNHSRAGRMLSAEHARPAKRPRAYRHNLRVLRAPVDPTDGLTDALAHCRAVEHEAVAEREVLIRVDPRLPHWARTGTARAHAGA